ncbi:hypothetical protein JY494_04420 [Serratia marcescens]|nr:hypothetical protein [Serratia marcescens]
MTPNPQSKSGEIQDTLTDYINRGERIDQFTFIRVMKDIKLLPDTVSVIMCTALAYGADKQFELAKDWFIEGLQYGDVQLARNYLAFLARTSHNELHKKEALRLGYIFKEPNILWLASSAAILAGDDERVSEFSERHASLYDGEEAREILQDGEMSASIINRFKSLSGLTSPEIDRISDVMAGIATRYNLGMIGADYYLDECGIDSAYVGMIHGNDPDVISDMNLDLAFALAENELLDGKKATAWFRGLPTQLDGE